MEDYYDEKMPASSDGGWTFGGVIGGLTGLAGAIVPAFSNGGNGGQQNNQAARQSQAAANSRANTNKMLLVGGAILAVVLVAVLVFRGK